MTLREEGGAVIPGTAREPGTAGESPLSAQVNIQERPSQAPPPAGAPGTWVCSSEECHRCSRVTGSRKVL